MYFSNRIKTAGEMVARCGTAADIGCDHCLTLIYLIESGRCERGIGVDVNKGPIEKGKKNVELCGLSDKIKLRLGDGLMPVAPGEADAIVIGGMGGHLITQILEKGINVAKSASSLVLQPHSDAYALRKFLHVNRFKIVDEQMILESGKYYVTLKAEKGKESYKEESDYLFGKILIEKKSPVLRDFLKEIYNRNLRISESLADKNTENCVLKLTEIKNMNTLITEVLLCL